MYVRNQLQGIENSSPDARVNDVQEKHEQDKRNDDRDLTTQTDGFKAN